MNLLDAVLAEAEDGPQVRESVQARQAYLWARADALARQDAEREPPQRMLLASLWMEASETAAFAGDLHNAREALRAAWHALALARNPFGESLRVAFFPSAPSAEALWGELRLPGEAPEGSPLAWALFNRQRERATQAPDGDGRDALPGEPRIGRLGWAPGELLGLAHKSRAEREALFTTALARQWDALQQAQRNRYLWREMLAPVALFDLELAVLLRHGLAQRGEGLATRWIDEALGDAPLRRFARSYLDTVGALMEQGPDEEGARRVRERQR